MRVYSAVYDQLKKFRISEYSPDEEISWAIYIMGVVDALKRRRLELAGVDMAVNGNVPIGAGLCSSAAFEVAAAKALREVSGLELGPLELALVGRVAENLFVGSALG